MLRYRCKRYLAVLETLPASTPRPESTPRARRASTALRRLNARRISRAIEPVLHSYSVPLRSDPARKIAIAQIAQTQKRHHKPHRNLCSASLALPAAQRDSACARYVMLRQSAPTSNFQSPRMSGGSCPAGVKGSGRARAACISLHGP